MSESPSERADRRQRVKQDIDAFVENIDFELEHNSPEDVIIQMAKLLRRLSNAVLDCDRE